MHNCPIIFILGDKHGKEIDCIVDTANQLIPIEKKSGKTYTKDYFKNLNYWNKLSNSHATDSYLIYNGDNNETLLNGHLISWNNLDEIPLE